LIEARFDGGKVTARFNRAARSVQSRYRDAFRKLANSVTRYADVPTMAAAPMHLLVSSNRTGETISPVFTRRECGFTGGDGGECDVRHRIAIPSTR